MNDIISEYTKYRMESLMHSKEFMEGIQGSEGKRYLDHLRQYIIDELNIDPK